jgi:hypothetical protein
MLVIVDGLKLISSGEELMSERYRGNGRRRDLSSHSKDGCIPPSHPVASKLSIAIKHHKMSSVGLWLVGDRPRAFFIKGHSAGGAAKPGTVKSRVMTIGRVAGQVP